MAGANQQKRSDDQMSDTDPDPAMRKLAEALGEVLGRPAATPEAAPAEAAAPAPAPAAPEIPAAPTAALPPAVATLAAEQTGPPSTLTRADLRSMSAAEIAKIPQRDVNAALQGGV